MSGSDIATQSFNQSSNIQGIFMQMLLNSPPSRRITQFLLLVSLTVSSNLAMNLPLAAQSTDNVPQQSTTTAPVLEPLQQALKAKKWSLADQETRRLIDPSSVAGN
jgi:hypothetical protein